jgi:copper transport protein
MKQLSIAILVALALCVGLTGAALAHAKRVSSVPEAGARLSKAPAKVTVLFTEEISAKPDQSFLRVTDARGALVAAGKLDTGDLDHKTLSATLPGSLADGVYTVSWQALTPDDNGVSHGSFSFGLNAAPGAQPADLEGEEGPADQPATAATTAATAAATTTAAATRPATAAATAAAASTAAPTGTAGSTPTASAGAPAGLPRTGGTADVSALALLAALAVLACGVWIRAKG